MTRRHFDSQSELFLSSSSFPFLLILWYPLYPNLVIWIREDTGNRYVHYALLSYFSLTRRRWGAPWPTWRAPPAPAPAWTSPAWTVTECTWLGAGSPSLETGARAAVACWGTARPWWPWTSSTTSGASSALPVRWAVMGCCQCSDGSLFTIQVLLHGEYMGHEGRPYCERCYHEKFGVRCTYCHRSVRKSQKSLLISGNRAWETIAHE